MAAEQEIILEAVDDLHVHLRQDALMRFVTPLITQGGVNRVLVMPNLKPEICTCAEAAAYRQQLQELSPNVEFFMTLYCGPRVTAEDLKVNAKLAGVQGVKLYPRGVTTNSAGGVGPLEKYYPLFGVLSDLRLSLHIHGESPGVHPLHAEAAFLPQLEKLAVNFPRLKIVLEHVSTKAGVEIVRKYHNLGGTITPHHLELETKDVLGRHNEIVNHHNFCKPIAKTPEDLAALREVVKEGHPRFFLGSDSAPHLRSLKEDESNPAAGVFTTPYLLAYLASTLDRLGCLDKLEGFANCHGAAFLDLPAKSTRKVCLKKRPFQVPDELPCGDSSVVPFKHKGVLAFELA